MRVINQRVSTASITIDGDLTSAIGNGFLVLLGIETRETKHDADWLCGKIAQLRVFFQAEDVMRDYKVTGVQTCALPICRPMFPMPRSAHRQTCPTLAGAPPWQ